MGASIWFVVKRFLGEDRLFLFLLMCALLMGTCWGRGLARLAGSMARDGYLRNPMSAVINSSLVEP